MANYGMLINTKKCIGCYACRTACQRQNNLLPDEAFIRFEEREVGTYPSVRVEHVPLQCCLLYTSMSSPIVNMMSTTRIPKGGRPRVRAGGQWRHHNS